MDFESDLAEENDTVPPNLGPDEVDRKTFVVSEGPINDMQTFQVPDDEPQQMEIIPEIAPEHIFEEMFRVFDINQNGFVTKAEVLYASGGNEKYVEDIIQELD